MKQYWYQAWYVLFQQPFSNLLTQHRTGLLSCLICTVRTALSTPFGSSALDSAVRTDLLTTMFTECSTTLFTLVPNSTVYAYWQLATGCAFLRVYNSRTAGKFVCACAGRKCEGNKNKDGGNFFRMFFAFPLSCTAFGLFNSYWVKA